MFDETTAEIKCHSRTIEQHRTRTIVHRLFICRLQCLITPQQITNAKDELSSHSEEIRIAAVQTHCILPLYTSRTMGCASSKILSIAMHGGYEV